MKVHNDNDLPTMPIADILPTQGNLKDLTEKNYNKLKNTIINRGFSVPVYVWEDSKGVKHLLDGHQRQRVLTTEGWNDPIPYLKIPAENIQEAMARLLEITSQYATITQEGIDEFIAKYELPEADVYEATSFDALTSFGDNDQEQEVVEDEAPEVEESEPPKSELGKIYQLGKHRVMCGDSTDLGQVSDLMNGEQADMVFTDPPYSMSDNPSGFISSKMRDGLKEIVDFDPTTIKDVLFGLNTSQFYIFTSKNLIPDYFRIFEDYGFNILVWCKDNPTPMTNHTFLPDIEYLMYFYKDGRVWNNGLDVSLYKKYYNSNKMEGRSEAGNVHATIKPIKIIADKVLISSNKNGIVIDLFLGSGSTLIACEQTDRICYGMELDPRYCDVIRKRYAKFVSPDNELPENWEELTPAI